MTQYTSWTIESRCQLDDKVERHHLIASRYCSNTWVMCWCSLNKILFHPRTSLPTIIATAIQATVYSDSKCMNLPPQILPQKGDEYHWPLQCMQHTHTNHKKIALLPWFSWFAYHATRLTSRPLHTIMSIIYWQCTCRHLHRTMTSWYDDPHHALTANFEDISKCRHFACHCDYTSDSSQHAHSGNYVWDTHVPGTISSEECVCPMEVGSRNGRSFHIIHCDNINSNRISIHYGKSKHVSKTQRVCSIVKTFLLTPVKTTHHKKVVP